MGNIENIYRLKKTQDLNGEKEKPLYIDNFKVGNCDIITNTELIEVKIPKYWKHALGQIIVYGEAYLDRECTIPVKPRRKVIHLLGERQIKQKQIIENFCKSYDVSVEFVPISKLAISEELENILIKTPEVLLLGVRYLSSKFSGDLSNTIRDCGYNMQQVIVVRQRTKYLDIGFHVSQGNKSTIAKNIKKKIRNEIMLFLLKELKEKSFNFKPNYYQKSQKDIQVLRITYEEELEKKVKDTLWEIFKNNSLKKNPLLWDMLNEAEIWGRKI